MRPDAGSSSSSDSEGDTDAGQAWGAATLPVHVPSAATAPSAVPGNTLLSQLHVPVGIGVAGSTATIPVRGAPRRARKGSAVQNLQGVLTPRLPSSLRSLRRPQSRRLST